MKSDSENPSTSKSIVTYSDDYGIPSPHRVTLIKYLAQYIELNQAIAFDRLEWLTYLVNRDEAIPNGIETVLVYDMQFDDYCLGNGIVLSYEELRNQFLYWDSQTLYYVIASLVSMGVLMVNQVGCDQRLIYYACSARMHLLIEKKELTQL